MSSDKATTYIAAIKRILVTIKALPIAPGELADDANIIEDIGLDSIELLNLMLEIEAQLDIQIDFDRMELPMLHAISTLAAFLVTMPPAGSPGPP